MTRFLLLTCGSGRYFLKAGKGPGVKGRTSQDEDGGKIQASERFLQPNLVVASRLEARGPTAAGHYPGIRYHITDQVLQHQPRI